jgi:Ca-activated chloride channel family protein
VGESVTNRIREGNRLFDDKNLEGAMGLYQDARTDAPESPELSYNIGNIYFHQNKLDEALNSFQEAVQKGEPDLKAKSQYNLGNTLYRQAQQKESAEKLEEALELAKKSLDTYKQCRQTRKAAMGAHYEEDADLNHNTEFVQREIRRIRDKILKRMKEQQNKQDQQNKEQQQQEKKQQEQASAQPEQKKDEKQKAAEEQKKQEQKEQKAQKMTPEQAQAMLKQLTDKEKEEMKKRAIQMDAPGYVEKDW